MPSEETENISKTKPVSNRQMLIQTRRNARAGISQWEDNRKKNRNDIDTNEGRRFIHRDT